MLTDLNGALKNAFGRVLTLIIKSDEIKSAHEHNQNE